MHVPELAESLSRMVCGEDFVKFAFSAIVALCEIVSTTLCNGSCKQEVDQGLRDRHNGLCDPDGHSISSLYEVVVRRACTFLGRTSRFEAVNGSQVELANWASS